VYTGNLAPEEFYYEADARIAMPGGGQALLVVGLQNGWTSTTQCGKSLCPEPGKQAIFGRVRFRIDGLTPGLRYTVRYPWGTQVVTPTTSGVKSVNLTIDTGCAATAGAVPCDPALALQAIVGPFLGWDPAVAPAAPDGFLGSYAVPHPITGSRVLDPDGMPQNYFSVEGPDLAPVRTDLFQVAGQLAPPGQGGPGTDTTPPSVPTGLAATAAADGSVRLSWNAATDDRGVTGYEVRRDGAGLPAVAGTTATDSGLAAGTTHAYTVSAVDAAHNVSTPSAPVTVTVPVPPPVDPATVPPTAPGQVAAALPATTLGAASVPVQLGWTPATAPAGVTGYDVSVTSPDGGAAATATAMGPAATVALAPGHRYDAAVRARNGAGLAGAWTRTSFAVALPQESDAAVTYSKGWARKRVTGAYGGSVEQTSTAKATATFRFTGTAVAWAATTAPGGGQATVTLDGSPLGTVDLRAATTTPRRLVLARSGLAAGAHTLTVTLPATTAKGKAATSVDVDAFAVLAP
jgi:chitodextrinase